VKRVFFFYSFLLSLFLLGCAHSLPDLHQKRFATLRFQNMLGLQTQATGCSLGSLGGLSLMEAYATSHPVDLSFQVGPAFAPILSGPFSEEELQEERKKVWRSFKNQKVSFYGVDAEDLARQPQGFLEGAQHAGIVLLSSNLSSSTSKALLFQKDLRISVNQKKLWILAFSERGSETLKGFEIEPPAQAFSKSLKELPADTEAILVLGALKKETRSALSKLSPLPTLFLGGTSQEKNTTRLEVLGSQKFFGRSPAFGTGFSEIVLGSFEKDALGKAPQVQIGKFKASLYSETLSEKEKSGAQCVPSSTP